MALNITTVARKFSFIPAKGGAALKLADPNPAFTPAEVMNFYSNAHPELTTATIDGPKMTDNGAEYEFKKTVGTKG